jgi:hypothetical protein
MNGTQARAAVLRVRPVLEDLAGRFGGTATAPASGPR